MAKVRAGSSSRRRADASRAGKRDDQGGVLDGYAAAYVAMVRTFERIAAGQTVEELEEVVATSRQAGVDWLPPAAMAEAWGAARRELGRRGASAGGDGLRAGPGRRGAGTLSY